MPLVAWPHESNAPTCWSVRFAKLATIRLPLPRSKDRATIALRARHSDATQDHKQVVKDRR